MGTSTPGLAHAIATRHPGRVAPDPRGVSVGAPRPAASRWQFRGGRSPGSRVDADHWPSRYVRWPHSGSARHLQLRGQPRPGRTPHRVPVTATSRTTRRLCGTQARCRRAWPARPPEHAKRKRIGSDRDDPSQGVQRQPAVFEKRQAAESPTALRQMTDHGKAARLTVGVVGRERDRGPHLLGRLGDRAYDEERQTGRGRLRDRVTVGVERRSEGRLEDPPFGAGRGRQLVAAGYARDPHLDVVALRRAAEPRARPDPWQCFDRSAEPRCQQARHRPGATPARARRPSETHQGDRAFVPQLFGSGPRSQGAAAADEDQRRVVFGEVTQAIGFGLKTDDHPEPGRAGLCNGCVPATAARSRR